jgi:hypothetical protein
VTVTSDPNGARVSVFTRDADGTLRERLRAGLTPIVLQLPRREATLTIRVEKDGCAPVDVPLQRTVSGWIAGNLIVANPLSMQGMTDPGRQYPRQLAIGLPLMFGVDALTGATFKLPKKVHAPVCGR